MSFVSLSETREHILNVLAHRIANGCFSERMLAKRAGLSQSHVHRILARTRVGTEQVLDSLAGAGHVYPIGDKRNEWDPEGWWLR